MSEGATGAATMAGEAVGVARGVEQLGIVGVLALVIIASWAIIAVLIRAHTSQGTAFAAELAKWVPHWAATARRARETERKVDALDARMDRLADTAPRSRRGDP